MKEESSDASWLLKMISLTTLPRATSSPKYSTQTSARRDKFASIPSRKTGTPPTGPSSTSLKSSNASSLYPSPKVPWTSRLEKCLWKTTKSTSNTLRCLRVCMPPPRSWRWLTMYPCDKIECLKESWVAGKQPQKSRDGGSWGETWACARSSEEGEWSKEEMAQKDLILYTLIPPYSINTNSHLKMLVFKKIFVWDLSIHDNI